MTPPRDNPGVLFPPPLIYLAGLLAGWLLERAAPLHFVAPDSASRSALRIAGIALIVVGAAIMGAAVRAFRRAGTHVIPTRPATTVVAVGPYRFTRNPMYLGFTIAYLGITLWANAVWPLILLSTVLAVMWFGVISREERYLEAKFGDAYRSYKSAVRRWI